MVREFARARLTPLLLATLCLGQGAVLWAQDAPTVVSYPVSVGDVLSVVVFDNPDLSGEFTVHEDGYIVYPLLGRVELTGRSPTAVSELLTSLLERDYLHDPVVTVAVKHFSGKTIKILGDVTKPGLLVLDTPPRLLDVMLRVGGVPSQLGGAMRGRTVRVVRKTALAGAGAGIDGNPPLETLQVDLYDLLVEGKDSSNIFLHDGDLVYVPPVNLMVHVIGEVKNPGAFPFQEGMTVLKAVTVAGGPTKKASVKNVVVLRVADGKVVRIRVGRGDLLCAEDIVEVPLSFW